MVLRCIRHTEDLFLKIKKKKKQIQITVSIGTKIRLKYFFYRVVPKFFVTTTYVKLFNVKLLFFLAFPISAIDLAPLLGHYIFNFFEVKMIK